MQQIIQACFTEVKFLIKSSNMFSVKKCSALFQSVLLQPDHKDERVGEAGRDGGQERCGQDARVLTGTHHLPDLDQILRADPDP